MYIIYISNHQQMPRISQVYTTHVDFASARDVSLSNAVDPDTSEELQEVHREIVNSMADLKPWGQCGAMVQE